MNRAAINARAAGAVLATAAALMLAGCVNLGGGKPLPFLLTLDSDAAPSGDAVRDSATAPVLRLGDVAVPQKLRTPRIPVQQGAGAVAYMVDAAWVEAPQRLFRRLLADHVAASTPMLVLTDTPGAKGAQLSGELIDFGLDASSGRAIVTFQAQRIAADGTTISQRRFTASEAVGSITARPAGTALTRAANRVAADVAAWVAEG